MSIHLQRPLQATLASSTSDSIESRIGAAPLQLDPYPHLILPDVLPAFTLADVRSYWPDESAFSSYGDGHGRTPGDPGRFGLYISGSTAAERCQVLDEDSRDYWRSFVAGPVKNIVTQAYRRYLPALRARFGGNLPRLELETYGALVICYDRVAINVHADHPANLFNCLIYLNNGMAEDGSGTTVYAPKAQGFTHDGLSHLAREDFDAVETIPFRDNQLFSLLRTGNSFHGVDPLPVATPTQRITMNIPTRITDRCLAELYGEDVVTLFQRKISGHCPWLMPGLNAWRDVDWDDTTPASEEEMQPILNSFRYGEERL